MRGDESQKSEEVRVRRKAKYLIDHKSHQISEWTRIKDKGPTPCPLLLVRSRFLSAHCIKVHGPILVGVSLSSSCNLQ